MKNIDKKQGNKIIIIDDDPAIQELLMINLVSRGYDIVIAQSGEEALAKLKIEKPDLIILDIMMPGMDGWEVCKIVRDHHEYENTKIIMLTAKNRDRDKMIGKSILKADEYITKPFEIDELITVVGKLIDENK